MGGIKFDEASIDKLLDAIPVISGRIDQRGYLKYASARLAQRLKKAREELVGQPIREAICHEVVDAFSAKLQAAMRGDSVIFKEQFLFDDLGDRELEIGIHPYYSESGEIIGAVFFSSDLTALENLQNSERELKHLLSALDQHAIVAVADTQGVIQHVNDQFCQISQYSRNELVGQNHRIVKSGFHDPDFYAKMWGTIASGETWKGEVCNRAKDGSLYWVQTTITPILGEDGFPERYVSIRADITPLKTSQQREHRLAYYDPLTDLPNRRFLKERLTECWWRLPDEGQHAALILLDIDNFRAINDLHGHAAGDQVLKGVAARLSRKVEHGTVVFHLGGDEFAILVDAIPGDLLAANSRAGAVIASLRSELIQPHTVSVNGHQESVDLVFGASFGAVSFSHRSKGPSEVMQNVDMALIEAKSRGKNQLAFYDQTLREKINAKYQLEQDLRAAIVRDQLRLFYQPIVDQSKKIVGFEALIRWEHPVLGMVSPGTFIPLAEETRLIMPIGWWVLETACSQLKAWKSSPHTDHWSVSVNVSARQLRDPNFTDRVIGLIHQKGVNPNLLCLELTETALIEDLNPSFLRRLDALRTCGVQLALDDFGTGFSSLSYLKILPLTKVKIDQSFVKTLLSNPKDQGITQAVLMLAQVLNLDVVAEGVEITDQFEYLKGANCNLFQGYLFGRPAPESTFSSQ